MKWKMPGKIKIYEALGCVADVRVRLGASGNEAEVLSSSGNKSYVVKYDPKQNAIMCNDNGSFWQGYLGYPAIAYLMEVGVIEYDKKVAKMLDGIKWKDLNTKFKNDFNKTLGFILKQCAESGHDTKLIEQEVEKVLSQIIALDLGLLGKKIKPPIGY